MSTTTTKSEEAAPGQPVRADKPKARKKAETAPPDRPSSAAKPRARTKAEEAAPEKPSKADKPTIGRVVHYRGNGEHECWNGSSVHAAMITGVVTDTCVNLTVMPDCHIPTVIGAVEMADTADQPGRWFWPQRA